MTEHRLWRESVRVPDSWRFIPLRQLLSHVDAGSSPLCDSEPAVVGRWGVLKVSAVSWDGFNDRENKALPSALEPNPAEEVSIGDIIASRANTTELCGAVQRVQSLYTRLLLCDKTWRLHPIANVDPDWLVAVLKLRNSRRQIEAVATGTSDSMKNVSKRDFLAIHVPVPEPEEQRRIAAALKLADDAIQKARAEFDAAQDLKRSLEAGLLTGQIDKQGRAKVKTKAGTYPQGWTVLPLKSLAVIGSGVTLNQDRAAKENACRYLTVAHVQRGSISSDDPRYLELSEGERKSRLLEAGDILVVEGHANSMEIGRAAMFEDTGIETTFQNHLFRVRADANLILPKFLLHILNSERVQRYWNAVCNTSSGLNTINRRNLRNVLLPHPGTNEQQEIIDALDTAEQNTARLAVRAQALDELKRSLLQNLLTGKIRIPEGAIHA
jgi:type I restriction enzyme S subunit